MSYIITYYLPSGLFVVVSWISFLIPPDIVPGQFCNYHIIIFLKLNFIVCFHFFNQNLFHLLASTNLLKSPKYLFWPQFNEGRRWDDGFGWNIKTKETSKLPTAKDVWSYKNVFLKSFEIQFLGRMALLITLFLVLINIFNNVTTNSPKVGLVYGWGSACFTGVPWAYMCSC